ncbi:amidase family protein [Atopococcus tabaci]|uniref:amidase family protein n=1 Tax=Atopococcus tabaci TaxID=269774 RepID=UPI0024097026|nr:amidase family protein [Atopococcus tabaci]
MNSIILSAKKSFLAMKNPYDSVERVFPMAIDELTAHKEVFYTGVKNVPQIPASLLKKLKQNGQYVVHTLDKAAIGGRAVDMQRVNPISGRPMTGSSSGTAINVLLGINDLGIGTDGGGSVLAPAMALNLFGFISPLIAPEHTKQFHSVSTDNVSFTPSIGYMTRTFSDMQRVLKVTFKFSSETSFHKKVALVSPTSEKVQDVVNSKQTVSVEVASPDRFGSREPLIRFLKDTLPQYDFLLSEEGPVDFNGLGDSVLGHMGERTQMDQKQSGKGLIRVANMAGATALSVPKKDFASAYVLICESKLEKIQTMLQFAENLAEPQDELLKRYFMNTNNYFADGFEY